MCKQEVHDGSSPEVLDVLQHRDQLESVLQGIAVDMSLRGGPPVDICKWLRSGVKVKGQQEGEGLTWFLVVDIDVEGADQSQSDESAPPINDEHDA